MHSLKLHTDAPDVIPRLDAATQYIVIGHLEAGNSQNAIVARPSKHDFTALAMLPADRLENDKMIVHVMDVLASHTLYKVVIPAKEQNCNNISNSL